MKGPRSDYIPVAKSTFITQVLVSNTILQKKELGLFGEVAESRAKAEHIQDGTGISHSTKKWENAKNKKPTLMGICQRDMSNKESSQMAKAASWVVK